MAESYDAIVIGARCGGAPTAMLLARKGTIATTTATNVRLTPDRLREVTSMGTGSRDMHRPPETFGTWRLLPLAAREV